jgi:hypothetical protein
MAKTRRGSFQLLIDLLDVGGGWSHSGHPPLADGATHDQVITSSAADSPTLTAVTGATRATRTITGAVDLVTEQVEVDEVQAESAPADTTGAAVATVAATAAAVTTAADHRHDGTGRQQLDVLAVNLSKAQCVRHQSS